jgi:hypothetical protein
MRLVEDDDPRRDGAGRDLAHRIAQLRPAEPLGALRIERPAIGAGLDGGGIEHAADEGMDLRPGRIGRAAPVRRGAAGKGEAPGEVDRVEIATLVERAIDGGWAVFRGRRRRGRLRPRRRGRWRGRLREQSGRGRGEDHLEAGSHRSFSRGEARTPRRSRQAPVCA